MRCQLNCSPIYSGEKYFSLRGGNQVNMQVIRMMDLAGQRGSECRRIKIIAVLSFLLTWSFLLVGGSELRVKNYGKESYGASSQNWSVTQDRNGYIFIANSFGLLEFDGATWSLYPSSDGNIIRAVAADSTGRVYSSGYRELGYWERDAFGRMVYTSLSEKARAFFAPNVEFWNIWLSGSRVIFQAFTQTAHL